MRLDVQIAYHWRRGAVKPADTAPTKGSARIIISALEVPAPITQGTLDLIFAREPVPADWDAKSYEIFDGQKLVPIRDYLKAHPRPDLIRLEERINELSAVRYGNRAGDVLLLARACTNLPIEERYSFSAVGHYTWQGSACEADSHIPFILAQQGGSG